MAPSPTASDRLLAVICLLGASYALVSSAHLALGIHEHGVTEQLVYPSTVRTSTLLLIGSLLLLLTLSLLSIAWRTGGSKSPRASSIACRPLTMVLWSTAAAWWLLVNYPIPALTHHVDKYIVGLTILVLWSLAYLFVPRRLDAFVLSRIFKLGTLLAVNMLVFALTGEIALRLIDPWLARLGPFASKDTPSSLSPHTPIDGSIGQSNALGFRDREWSRHKTSTAPRIIAIGDSFTYGAGVSYDDTFVTLLSQAVAGRIPGAEILNMGVSAWGPHEELALLKSTVLDFHPDLVILNVYAGNDIVEDARFEPALFVGGHRYRVHVSGNWFHDHLGPQQWFLYHHLNYLTAVGPLRVRQALGMQGQPGTRWRRSAQSFCSLYGKRPTLYFEYHWTQARHVYEEMLILLRSHGIDFLVVIHPDPEQLYEWTIRHPCAPEMGLEAYDFERPQRHLQEWTSAHLVPTVDLLPAFKKLPNPDAYFLGRIDDNHYSSDGHRLAAGQILPGLLERLAHRP